MTPQQREFLITNQKSEQTYYDLAKAEIGTVHPDWIHRVNDRIQELKAATTIQKPLTVDEVITRSLTRWHEGR